MARYEHLPIYKTALELGVILQGVVARFSRYNKYSLGSDLREISRRIIQLIVRANSTDLARAQVLGELVVSCEMLKTMLVFAKEARAFDNFCSFQRLSLMAVALCKQSEGWLQSSKKGLNHPPPARAGR
jgi:hypothetical protein